MSTRTRKRGRYDESDVRHVSEQNKKLKRKLASLLRENGRLKKEGERWRGATDSADAAEEVPEQAPPPPPAEISATCPHCGTSNVEGYTLEVRGESRKYLKCKNAGCRRNSRVS